MTAQAGYLVDHTCEGHPGTAHLYIGAGHLTQQVRAWTARRTGVHDHLRVGYNASTQRGFVMHGGVVIARFTVTVHTYPGSTR